MDGNPVDECFRPPDPPLEAENPTVPSKIHNAVDSASSSSSRRREEAIHVATIEAKIDASRRNSEQGHNISGQNIRVQDGEIPRIDPQMDLGRVETHASGSPKSRIQGQKEIHRQESQAFDPAKSQSEVVNSQGREEATSTSIPARSENNQQKSISDNLSHSLHPLNQPIVEENIGRNIENPHEGHIRESREIHQEQGNRDGNQLGNTYI